MITPLLKVDDAHIGHSVMIRAQGNEVVEVVGSTFGNGRDVVNVDLIIKTTDGTAVFVAERNLLANELPPSALPVPVEIRLFRVVGDHTQAIAEVLFFQLARKAEDCLSAMCAGCFGLALAARRRYKTLPSAVTFIVATGAAYVLIGVLYLERFAAHGASERNITALKVAVVLAAVLVKVQVSALLARLLVPGDNLPTTTGAIDNFGAGIFGLSGHTVTSW